MYGATSSTTDGILEISVDGSAPDDTRLHSAMPQCSLFWAIFTSNASESHTATLTLRAATADAGAPLPPGLTLIGITHVIFSLNICTLNADFEACLQLLGT